MLKLALTEVLQEQREMFAEVLTEVLEDFALARAIEEDEQTEQVSRDTIFQILQSHK